jgi:hypothetical protein
MNRNHTRKAPQIIRKHNVIRQIKAAWNTFERCPRRQRLGNGKCEGLENYSI